MNTNDNNNELYTIDSIGEKGEDCVKNVKRLPKIKFFRVQSLGLTGKMGERRDKHNGWAVLVACEGRNGLELVTHIAREYGMIVKGTFNTKEQAFENAMKMKNTWGVMKVKQTQKKAGITAQYNALIESLKRNGFTEEQIETLKKVS